MRSIPFEMDSAEYSAGGEKGPMGKRGSGMSGAMLTSLPLKVPLVLALVVLVSRLPLLALGFGLDADSWSLAATGAAMIEHGTYSPSRPPGYPLVELLLAPLVPLGSYATNTLTALATALSAVVLMRLLERSGAKHPAALALAFTCMPSMWIASTTTIDYPFALLAGFLCLDAADRGRFKLAGLWLGLAVTARATSTLFVLPLMLFRPRGFGFPAAAVILAGYAPVVMNEGAAGLLFAGGERPPLSFLLREGLIAGPGEIGAAVLLLCLLVAASAKGEATLHRAGALLAVAHLALFLVFPYEDEYLLPAFAGLWLWMGSRLPAPLGLALAPAMILSAWIGVLEPAPIPEDRAERREQLNLLAELREQAASLPANSTLIAGQMTPMVRFVLEGEEGEALAIVSQPEEAQVRAWIDADRHLRYVPGIEAWYQDKTGLDVTRFAQPLPSP